MRPTFSTPRAFADNQDFDFIIVGGGAAGLALACRLSDEPSFNVGVIEAGDYFPNHPGINVPGLFGSTFGDPSVDWSFFTEPQKHASGRKFFHPRGKVLGGSSALNIMGWTRAANREYDALERLGNPTWNASRIQHYIRRAETFHVPISSNDRATCLPEAHGSHGPIHASHPTWYSDLHDKWFEELDKMGIPWNIDPDSGHNIGRFTTVTSVDPRTGTRSYSTNGYFEPVSSRPNLYVLLKAHVLKLDITDAVLPDDRVRASGVVFVCDGEQYEVKVKKEILLCAGSFQTPQILEVSGIGNPAILAQHNIPLKVPLPSVGENLQDHLLVPNRFEVDPDLTTLDILRDPKIAKEMMELYETKAQGPYSCTHSAFAFLPLRTIVPDPEERLKMKQKADAIVESREGGNQERVEILKDWFDDEYIAQMEIIQYPGFFPDPSLTPDPSKRYQTLITLALHPFSHGSVHITSSSSLDPPAINPEYFSDNVDLDVHVRGRRWLKDVVSRLSWVRGSLIDESGGEEESVKRDALTVFHPIGTASMLPRDKGGVVDKDLCVYGVQNLRVVDASIIPIIMSFHPAATVYGIAEMAAEVIKRAYL